MPPPTAPADDEGGVGRTEGTEEAPDDDERGACRERREVRMEGGSWQRRAQTR